MQLIATLVREPGLAWQRWPHTHMFRARLSRSKVKLIRSLTGPSWFSPLPGAVLLAPRLLFAFLGFQSWILQVVISLLAVIYVSCELSHEVCAVNLSSGGTIVQKESTLFQYVKAYDTKFPQTVNFSCLCN